MAWYYGTYSCGHEGRVNIIGPTKDRQRKADYRFDGMCPDCYAEYLQEEREKQNAKAAEKAKEMELPELKGSEKQIAWANTIRQNVIDMVYEYVDNKYNYNIGMSYDDLVKALDYMIATHMTASWWIENRDTNGLEGMKQGYMDMKKAKARKDEDIKMKDIKAEATVYPENKITDAVVEIVVEGDTIKAYFEKNDKFISVVKSLKYKWKGIWQREINQFAGTAEDRAAELGNKLLNAGFPVMIMNEETRKKAVDGTFEPEYTRWIARRKSGKYKGWLSIVWEERNDDLYRKAREIKTSRWDNNIVVKIEHHREVEDFAEINDFKVSPAAKDAIIEYEEMKAKSPVVKAKKIKEPEKEDKLSKILETDDSIIEDLKDEN